MRIYFRGSTTKNSVGYACGETMTFDLQLVKDGEPIGCPKFKWELFADDGQASDGIMDGTDGHFVLDTTISVPGFVRLIVRACDEAGEPLEGYDKFEGGAGADIDKIEQAVPVPEEYDAYWASERAAIDAFTPELLEKVQVESDNPDFDLFDVKISAPTKRPVSGYLSVPKNAAEKSCGAFLGFVGAGGFSAPKTYRPGQISLHLNPHGIENGRDEAYYAELKQGELKGFGFNGEQNQRPDTCYFHDMIRRGMTALKWLKTAPEYDGSLIDVAGGSMGAMQAVNVTANGSGIGTLTITVPWFCDIGGKEIGRQNSTWRPGYAYGLRFYDTASAASRVSAHVKVKIECGLGDYVCPPSGEVVLWHHFKGEKSFTFVQNMTHPYRPVERITYDL